MNSDGTKPTIGELRDRLHLWKYRKYLHPRNCHYLAYHSLLRSFLFFSGSLEEAIPIVFDFYLAKLLPWPLDEAYLAQTVVDFVISHLITIIVGVASATYRYYQAI